MGSSVPRRTKAVRAIAARIAWLAAAGYPPHAPL